MQIVTDTGMDLLLEPDMMPEIDLHTVRHMIEFEGKVYRSGKDIQADELYAMFDASESMPLTSQPSANEFAELYTELAKTDPEILSIHMSSGLSGVVNAATAGAQMVSEANVTIVDSKTLSVALGWQVAAAARALKAGWPKEKIIELVKKIGDASNSIYTLTDLKYLIHGGRIGHMKGLIASMLKIKPVIGVEKINGTYEQLSSSRTLKKAFLFFTEQMAKIKPLGSNMRVQIGHAANPAGVEMLHKVMEGMFNCDFMPVVRLSPVLAAHTGPTMVGMAYAPQEVFEEIP